MFGQTEGHEWDPCCFGSCVNNCVANGGDQCSCAHGCCRGILCPC